LELFGENGAKLGQLAAVRRLCMKRSRSPSNDHAHEEEEDTPDCSRGEDERKANKKSRAEPVLAAQHSPSFSSSHHLHYRLDTMEVVPVVGSSSDVPEEAKNIDLDLYSRQYYVYGGKAMTKMADSTVFLSGLGGLGVEIGTAWMMTLTLNSLN
jgi:hypothetical protein